MAVSQRLLILQIVHCGSLSALIFLSYLSPIWETQRFWQFCNQSVQQKRVGDEKQVKIKSLIARLPKPGFWRKAVENRGRRLKIDAWTVI